MVWWRIELPYAVFAVVTDREGERIAQAAPIGRWMIGKSLAYVASWVERKRGRIELL